MPAGNPADASPTAPALRRRGLLGVTRKKKPPMGGGFVVNSKDTKMQIHPTNQAMRDAIGNSMKHTDTTVNNQEPQTQDHADFMRSRGLTQIDNVPVGKTEWFNRQVERGAKSYFSEVVTIDVDLAKVLLLVNDENRKIAIRNYNNLVSDIKGGRFVLNGQTIIVSDTGQLNDGQHRCRAVIDTGIPIPSFMVFGVERASRTTVDLNSVRKSHSFIQMEGGSNTFQAAAVSASLLIYKRGIMSNHGNGVNLPTTSEVVNNYWRNRSEIDEAIRIVKLKESRELSSINPLAACYIILKRHNPGKVDEFFDMLVYGAGYERTSPVYVTRRRLIDVTSLRLPVGQKMSIIFSGWNAWRLGQTPRTIQVRDTYPRLVP